MTNNIDLSVSRKYGFRHWLWSSDPGTLVGNLLSKAQDLCPDPSDPCSLLNDLLNGENYSNYERGDVPHQIMNAVVLAALLHQKLDTPSTKGTLSSKIPRAVEDYVPFLAYTNAANYPLVNGGDRRLDRRDQNSLVASNADNEFRVSFNGAVKTLSTVHGAGTGTGLRFTHQNMNRNPNADTDNIYLISNDGAAAEHKLFANTVVMTPFQVGLAGLYFKIAAMSNTNNGELPALYAMALNTPNLASTVIDNVWSTGGYSVNRFDAAGALELQNGEELIDALLGDGRLPAGLITSDNRMGIISCLLHAFGVVSKNIGNGAVTYFEEVRAGDVTNATTQANLAHANPAYTTQAAGAGLLTDLINNVPHSLAFVVSKITERNAGARDQIIETIRNTFKEHMKNMAKNLLEIALSNDARVPDGSGFAAVRGAGTRFNQLVDAAGGTPQTNRIILTNRLREVWNAIVANDSAIYQQMVNEMSSALRTNILNKVKEIYGTAYESTLEAKYPRMLWDQVYKHWNTTLPKEAKDYFKRYLTMRKQRANGEWDDETEPDNIPDADFKKWRFNLIKDSDGKTKFSKDLAQMKFSTRKFKRVYYTNYQGQKLYADTEYWDDRFSDLFTHIYHAVYYYSGEGAYVTVSYGNAPHTFDLHKDYEAGKESLSADLWRGTLGIDKEKLIRRRLFDKAKADCAPVPDDDTDFCDMITKEIIHRDKDGKCRYYRMFGDKKVYLDDHKDENVKNLFKKNCYATNAEFKDPNNCDNFIMDCIISGDKKNIDHCLKYLEDLKDYTDDMKKEFNNMHPLMALRTLQQLGFRETNKYDSRFGGRLNKIESVDHWLATRGGRKVSKEEINKLKDGNKGVLDYLRLVVDFVNSNPAILNKNYTGETEESMGDYEKQRTQFVEDLGIKTRIVAPHQSGAMDWARMRHNNLSNLRGVSIQNRIMPFFNVGGMNTPFGSVISPGATQTIRAQMGGGMPTSNKGMYRNAFKSAVQRLQSRRGKKLSDQDEKRAYKLIDQLENLYDKLFKDIIYIEEYISLTNAFGAAYDDTDATLSMEKLKKLTDYYKNVQEKYFNRENYIIKLMENIEKITEGEDEYKNIELRF